MVCLEPHADQPCYRLALNAMTATNPVSILTSRATNIADQQVFNLKIPFEGAPITNQRSSGRCWLFASTNVFRIALMQKYKLDSFELSQSYLFFHDKLEKSNWFLEQIIDTAHMSLDDRLVQTMLHEPISDGGQWDMVYNLVSKYGLVPQVLYPDSYNATASRTINHVVISKLREGALTLRRLVRSRTVSPASVTAAKDKMMREIHLILTLTLGPPPSPSENFIWEYLDREGKSHTLSINPREFAKDIRPPSSAVVKISSAVIENMVSLVNDPRHPYLSLMTVDRLGNIVGGRPITYINVGMGLLKSACIRMIKAGIPVFFGSDVGKFSNSTSGIMDLNLIDYELGFNVTLLGMSKSERLQTGESQMTHAMVLTAVHLDEEGRPARWRVQNSWGENAGDKGWFVMSDAWMDEFVYQAVVDPKFLDREVRDVLTKEPLVLPLWDPMGSLA